MGDEDREARTRSAGPVTDSGETSAGAPAPGGEAESLPVIDPGCYELGEEIGRGGLGLLLRARDRRLGRVVAVKQLIAHSTRLQARFVREARITARLQHPSIVPVHEAGWWPDGQPFYAMKLVAGRALSTVLEETADLPARVALLPTILAVAEAVAYAHAQRIIHRDLKPSNVMVGEFGETVVIDWGLAKDLAAGAAEADGEPVTPAEAGLTSVGAVLGTPPYLAPEQARGEPTDERADVYALGAILYQTLAGCAPYRSPVAPPLPGPALLARIVAQPPRPLVELEPAAPADLVAVVAKAMARDPADRYPDARALADDLRRFQTGQLVAAHRYGAGELVRRWLRRNRHVIAVGAVAAIALATLGVWSLVRVVRERDAARAAQAATDRARATAVAAENAATARERDLILAQARGQLATDPTASIAWIETYLGRPGADRGAALALVAEARARGVAERIFHYGGSGAPSASARFIELIDGGRLDVIGTLDGTQRTLERDAAFVANETPDASRIATMDAGGDVHVHEVGSWASRTVAHEPGASTMTFSADGETLEIAAADHIRVVDLAAGSSQLIDGLHDLWLTAMSRDGRWVSTIHDDRTVGLISLANGVEEPLGGSTFGVPPAFTRDSARVVWADAGGTISLRDLRSGVTRRLGTHGKILVSYVFTPDGAELVTVGIDSRVKVWDVATGSSRLLGELRDFAPVLAVSPDGRQVAAGGEDGQVLLWQIRTGEAIELRGHQGAVTGIDFLPDGRLVTTDRAGEARVWARWRPFGETLPVHPDDVKLVGDEVVVSGNDAMLHVWHPATGEVRKLPKPGVGGRIAVAPGVLLTASDDVRLWDLAAGTSRVLVPNAATGAALVTDGSTAFVATDSGAVDRVDVASGAIREIGRAPRGVYAIVTTPDGELVAAACQDGSIRIWDRDGALRFETHYTSTIGPLTVSPDGARVAWDSPDGIVVWERPTGRITTLRGHQGDVAALAFSADGRVLVSGASDHDVRIWSLADGTSRRLRHPAGVSALGFARDGQVLVTGCDDGALRFYDTRTWQLFAVEPVHWGGVSLVGPCLGERGISRGKIDNSVQAWIVPAPPADLAAALAHLGDVPPADPATLAP